MSERERERKREKIGVNKGKLKEEARRMQMAGASREGGASRARRESVLRGCLAAHPCCEH